MTKQVLTVGCKLEVEAEVATEIDATLQAFADCCNWINQTVDPKVTGRLAIHKEVYHLAKQSFGLPANLVCQAILRVASNRKTAKAKKQPVKKFKPTSAGYDARVFMFREDVRAVKLTLLNNRQQFPLLIGNYQRHLLRGESPTSATLIKRTDGDYYIQMQVLPKPPAPIAADGCLGVDLGRRDIAHTSEGDSWDAESINRIRDHYAKLRQDLQKKASEGTRSSRCRCRKLLQRLSGRERRFQAGLNHTISYRIVQKARSQKLGIAIEDLTGIRERTNTKPRNKTERRRSNSWSFYHLRQFSTYKALRFGVKLVSVPPAYTSRTCHKCLHIHPELALSYRSEKSFKCGHCGWHGDADFNAANVISLLGAAINQPGGPYLSCAIWSGKPVQLNLFDWDTGLLKTSSMPQAWAG